MLKTTKAFFILFLIMTSSVTFAFDYKKTDDFKKLESFKSVDEFESYYNKYVHKCLDNTGGGTGGIPCFIGHELWDRELNIYYNRLMKVLGKKEKELLKESQLEWISARDKAMALNSVLLDNKYKNETGTMYSLMRADDADEIMTSVVRQRALLLRKWLEFIKNQKKEERKK